MNHNRIWHTHPEGIEFLPSDVDIEACFGYFMKRYVNDIHDKYVNLDILMEKIYIKNKKLLKSVIF